MTQPYLLLFSRSPIKWIGYLKYQVDPAEPFTTLLSIRKTDLRSDFLLVLEVGGLKSGHFVLQSGNLSGESLVFVGEVRISAPLEKR